MPITSLSLSLWLAGELGFLLADDDVCDPWQTPVTSAVEAVEPCSRRLLYQQSWCALVLMASSR
ncbi:hypothetical protein SynWH8103_00482 [Synechococcus sp. WH 8103]|nr:hypothetical protein SynWH8103_00482 [Synechococcus sp. WH 8103]